MSIPQDIILCHGCNEVWTIDHLYIPWYQYVHKDFKTIADTTFKWCIQCNQPRAFENFPTDKTAEARLERHMSRLKRLEHHLTALILVPIHDRPFRRPEHPTETDVLNRLTEGSSILERSLGDRLLRVRSKVSKIRELQHFLSLRTSKPRCLSCGSHWSKPISMGTTKENLKVLNFRHPNCGGIMEKSWISIHYSDKRKLPFKEQYLDIEGRLISKPTVVI